MAVYINSDLENYTKIRKKYGLRCMFLGKLFFRGSEECVYCLGGVTVFLGKFVEFIELEDY